MDGIGTEELVAATLHRASAGSSGGGAPISTVVDRLSGSGQRLSRQAEIAVAVETLAASGLLEREPADDGDRLTLTNEGRAHASDVFDRLTERQIEVVDGDDRRKMTVNDAADEFDRSPVELVVDSSADGVVYREDRVADDDIVGREAEQDRFEAVLDRVRETGDGEVVRLVGPGGNGKTELANALLAATPGDVETIRVTSRDAENEPFQPLRDAFTQLGLDNPVEAIKFEADDADTFQTQQTGLFSEITESLMPESGVRVLFFDDVNRADSATWEYLADLSTEVADRPLMVVLSHRPGTVPEDAPIHPEASLEETRIELAGLDREGTKQLVEQVVGRRGAPDAFVDAVDERTGGTPLFVETTVETLLETNGIDPEFRTYPTDPQEFDLPEEVTETIQRQTVALEGEVRDVLEWVAVAGGYVPVSLVAATVDGTSERVGTVIDTMTGTGLLDQETRDGERWVTFRNEVFGDALADRLDDAEREQRHQTIARQLEDRLAEPDEPDHEGAADRAATVAYQYERSGDRASAIEWYETAADRATDVYAHETAIDHCYRVIDLARGAEDIERVLTANEELAEIYLVIGEYDEAEKHVRFVRERSDGDDVARRQRIAHLAARLHNARGDYDTAVETASTALDLADDATAEKCRILDSLAHAHRYQNDYESARELADRQRELASSLELPGLEAGAIRRLGQLAHKQADYERAREYLEASLDIYSRIGDREGEAGALDDLGSGAKRQSAYERAREHYERSLDIRREIGDRHREAKTRMNLGQLAQRQGDYDRAREHYERSLDTLQAVGDRHTEAFCLGNLGALVFEQGDYDRAREYQERSLELCREAGDRNAVARNLTNLGNIAARQGDYERAREYHERSLERTRELGDSELEAACLHSLGNIAARQGDYQRAQEYYEHALELKQDIGDRQGEADSLTGLGRLARRRGEPDRARAYYDDARDLARELGLQYREARALCGRCVLDRANGEFERASERVDQALELTADGGNRLGRERVRLAAAGLALARGDLDSAYELAAGARETFEELGTPLWLARSRRLLGEVAVREGDTATARDQFAAAVDTFDEIGAAPDTLETLELLVETCRDEGDDDGVEQWSRRAGDVLADAPAPAAQAHGQWVTDVGTLEEA